MYVCMYVCIYIYIMLTAFHSYLHMQNALIEKRAFNLFMSLFSLQQTVFEMRTLDLTLEKYSRGVGERAHIGHT